MKFEEYLRMLRWDSVIDIRVIRVKDLTDIKENTFFNAILIPTSMDDVDGVSYQIKSDVEDVGDRLELWPSQFAVMAAWPLNDLIKGAMYIEDMKADYFESEV